MYIESSSHHPGPQETFTWGERSFHSNCERICRSAWRKFRLKELRKGKFLWETCIICTTHHCNICLESQDHHRLFQISKNSTSPQRLADSQVWVGRFWHEMCWVCRAESWSCEQNGTQMMDVNIRGVPTNGVGKLGPYDGSGRNLSMWTSCQVFWVTR